jgi:pyruvate-ferredoxin/flavodoxin oxidoreductase
VIVGTNRDPATARAALSPRVARWLRDRKLRFLAVDARKIATETASQPNTIDQLAVWALLGAWLGTGSRSGLDPTRFSERLATRLGSLLGEKHTLVGEIAAAVARGVKEQVEVPARSGDGEPGSEQVDAPWTVQEATRGDGTVLDPARFWRSVGYLYDTGQSQNALTDPYLATGVVPARSSAFRDLSSYRIRVPSWLAENCTGCGLCWAHCPESALPPTIQSVAALVRAAMAACESKGRAMVQMGRIADHLATQANRVMAKGGPQPYVTAAALLEAAFAELVERMNLEGGALDALTHEFKNVLDEMGGLPVCRTEVFYDRPNQTDKGSGTLLSIAFNPLSCTACGICVEVCPEGALEWVEQTPSKVAEMRRTWEFQMSLPDAPHELVSRHVTDELDTHVHRLLDKQVYHSMVGGDGSLPGNGAKTAVHLVTAAVESVMRPRFRAHIDKLTALIKRIEEKIQGEFAGTLEINDFEAFGRRLDGLKRSRLTARDLSDLIGEEGKAHAIDGERLSRLNDLLRKIRDLRDRYAEGASGAGRARMILAIDAGSSFGLWTYPYNPHPHPWVRQLSGDGPALGEGAFIGVTRRLAEEFKMCRLAELELGDAHTAGDHDGQLEPFDWTRFSDEEWDLVPPVVVLGSPLATRLEGIARLLAGRYPIKVVMIDTDGPMIEGRHAAGASAPDVTRFALAQRHAFVLQSTIGHPGHLIRGVIHGIDRRGSALFHIYAPDPNVGGIAPEKVAEQARMGCDSRAWPLFEFDPDKPALVLDGNPDAEMPWTSTALPVREPTGAESTLTVPLTLADWAVHETRFHAYFRLVSKGHLNDRMKPLSEYVGLDPADREGFEPFVNVTDKAGVRLLAIVAPEMVASTEKAARFWSDLQRMATGAAGAHDTRAAAAVAVPVAHGPTAVESGPHGTASTGIDPTLYHRVADRLLRLSGYGDDPDFFRKSLREFVTRQAATEHDDEE